MTIASACLALRVHRAASPPQEPQLPRELGRGDVHALEHDAEFIESELTGRALTDQSANGVTFTTVRLADVDLSGSRLEHLAITDGVLRRCNLANVHAARASLHRVSVQGSRLTGIALGEATLSDVSLEGCRIDIASFGFSRLQRVTFEDCVLQQTDFLEAQLDEVRFRRCDLSSCDFRGARLKRCEFRRNDLTGLQGAENLRGAAMEWPDIVETAGVWAATLGIKTLDAD